LEMVTKINGRPCRYQDKMHQSKKCQMQIKEWTVKIYFRETTRVDQRYENSFCYGDHRRRQESLRQKFSPIEITPVVIIDKDTIKMTEAYQANKTYDAGNERDGLRFSRRLSQNMEEADRPNATPSEELTAPVSRIPEKNLRGGLGS
jgi:hypothetical protein